MTELADLQHVQTAHLVDAVELGLVKALLLEELATTSVPYPLAMAEQSSIVFGFFLMT